MKALLVIAHGSRRQASNDEVVSLTKQLAERIKPQYPIVLAGFLEIASPSITDALNNCLQAGATEITILPYFLAAGKHVHRDIPEEIAPFQQANPELNIMVLPHLGSTSGMIDLMASFL